jgi:hypothetical protein
MAGSVREPCRRYGAHQARRARRIAEASRSWLSLSRTSRNQKGRRRPSAVRATLDDPPIHIRPTVPAISGCKAKEPFRFRPLRHMQNDTAAFQSQRIFCRKRQESGDKRLRSRHGWSNRSAQACAPVSATISCALMRTISPSLRTLPSRT